MPKSQPKQDVVAEAQQVVVDKEKTVLALLYNPAHPVVVPQDRVKYETNRDNTAWVVILPALGVVATVTDKDGDPLTGRIDPGYGLFFAFRLYNRLLGNPDLLTAYRQKNDMPDLEKGYTGKLIPVTFEV